MQWDIFCKVIDNYGDIGVCWRLCRDLATRGEQVRLWVDDASALRWMAPDATTLPGVEIMSWSATPHELTPVLADGAGPISWPEPRDVVIEAFGCELPAGFVQRMAAALHKATWINLEYLTAEPFAERCHGLPSPVMYGPAHGQVKHFFYPGFTPGTGGLLREPGHRPKPIGFDRHRWLNQLGMPTDVEATDTGNTGNGAESGTATVFAKNVSKDSCEKWVSLFCYEPAGLPLLLEQLANCPGRTRLLVTSGRAAALVKKFLNKNGIFGIVENNSMLSISYLPTLSQTDFDTLLSTCDLNFVRGEDSLVRALWAGKPLVWHIYPQDDDAHHVKLQAFLDVLNASPGLRHWHSAWNGLHTTAQPVLSDLWRDATVAIARQHLLQQDDLTTQLMAFVARVRPAALAQNESPDNPAGAMPQ